MLAELYTVMYSVCVDGGHAKTIKLLIERGANPNSRGQFQRTPLYHAAFAGHLEAGQFFVLYSDYRRNFIFRFVKPNYLR